MIAGLEEASFVIYCARKAVTRADTTYVAGCLFRVVEVCAHALPGRRAKSLYGRRIYEMMVGRETDHTLAAHAFRAELVDECHLFIAPILVGGGKQASPMSA